jgi:hypothetical protein
MTLCIAATCTYQAKSTLVLCRDWQVNKGTLITSDDADKLREIEEGESHCSILISGQPTRADQLLNACDPAIRGYMRESNPADTDLHIDALLEGLRAACRNVKRKLVNHFVSMTLNMDFEEFSKHGREWLRESHYDDVWHEIRHLNLGAELLIALFDAEQYGQIVRVDLSGEVHWENDYSTIGTGSDIAQAFLCQNEMYDPDTITLGACIYELLRAKFAAERSRDVGTGTSVDIIVGGAQKYSISDKGFKYFENKLRPYKIPKITFAEDFLEEDIPAKPEPNVDNDVS